MINRQEKHPYIIIGAGLTGLTLAHLLNKAGEPVLLLEANERIGGRVYTTKDEKGTPFELGATWYSNQHQYLIDLLKDLKIASFLQGQGKYAIYEQFSTAPPQLVQLPQGGESSNRIAGGTQTIIDRLASEISPKQIKCNQIVKEIREEKDGIMITTHKATFLAAKVIATLPPNLFVNTITFSPSLPENLIKIAQATHTWMGDSIKVGFTYATPFWNADKSSGTIFSNAGPISEMYDHTNIEKSHYALKGFMNSAYYSVSKEERKEIALKQLRKYYGKVADTYISYQEMVWRKQPFTFAPYNAPIIPHQNNGHAYYRDTYFNNSLFIGGTETASQFPGYLDGAIRSAHEIFHKLRN